MALAVYEAERVRKTQPRNSRRANGAAYARSLYAPPQPTQQNYLHREHAVGEVYRSAQTLAPIVALLGIFVLRNLGNMPKGFEDFLLLRMSVKNALLLIVFALIWQKCLVIFGLHQATRGRSRSDEFKRVIGACTLGTLPAAAFPLVMRASQFGIVDLVLVWTTSIALTYLIRLALTAGVRPRLTAARQVIIVGSGPRAIRLYDELSASREPRYNVVGYVDSIDHEAGRELAWQKLGDLEDLEGILMHASVDEVLIALPHKSRYSEIQQAIEDCEHAGVQSKYLADIFSYAIARPRYEHTGSSRVVALNVTDDDLRLVVKRFIDVTGALFGLIALAPVMMLIALAIKTTSAGPVVFAQERFGLRKRRFRMYKFRTMILEAEAMQSSLEGRNEATGPVFKIKKDPRVTSIGRFLRRTSLDELPQLLNVLRGEMSLVGPRPLPRRDVMRFDASWLMRRFSVLPGLTCLWQVSGRSALCFDDWMSMDLRYIDTWSLALDLRILLRTIPAVLLRTGAS
ncbi:MAG: sugar transferase [Anaerolineae bacterium]|nr:sugar transferase [Gemmatimonadaceae bacterium]